MESKDISFRRQIRNAFKVLLWKEKWSKSGSCLKMRSVENGYVMHLVHQLCTQCVLHTERELAGCQKSRSHCSSALAATNEQLGQITRFQSAWHCVKYKDKLAPEKYKNTLRQKYTKAKICQNKTMPRQKKPHTQQIQMSCWAIVCMLVIVCMLGHNPVSISVTPC